jgi:hypothetical protein
MEPFETAKPKALGFDTFDAVAIQRFYLGHTGGLANVGSHQFIPPSRTYAGASGNQTDQNYDALIFGDVVSPSFED